MVDYYIHAKRIVSKRVPSDNFFYPILVCAIYGLLTKYKGNGMLIADLFRKTDLFFEEGTVQEILKRHHIESTAFDPDCEEDGVLTAYGVSEQGHSFAIDDHGNLVYVKDHPFIICSLNHYHPVRFLNTFCHEMGHLIKGERNNHFSHKEQDTHIVVIRNGLAHYAYAYRKSNQNLELTCSFAALDETINCIQTTDIMEEILALGEFVVDPSIKAFIDSLDKDMMKQDMGYTDLVNMMRPLWKSETFRSIIENHIVDGKMDTIMEEYDSLMGSGAFEEMSSVLDQAIEAVDQNDCHTLEPLEKQFQGIVDSFQKSVKEKKREE